MMEKPLNKVWAWIKTIAYKIADLIPHRFRREPPAPQVATPLEKKLGEEIQRRQKRRGKLIDTREGGPNMPKYQFCLLCHRQAKRKRKTMGGAYYKCSIHDEFFVRAARL